MAEKVVIGNAELWHGDCREVLPLLPAHDLLLTDPPYGIGRDGKPPSTSSHGGHKGYDKTGRRVSIEYALIKDMNDHAWRAQLLADKLNKRGKGWVHVNPIPLNPTPGSVWTSSTKEQINLFLDTLEAAGIPTNLRDTRGKEIDGACGQLAAAN